MSHLRSESQLAQPQGFVPEQIWPALLLASGGEGCKPLQLREVLVQGLTPPVDFPMQVKRWTVGWVGASTCTLCLADSLPAHVPSGLGNKATNMFQPTAPFPWNCFHLFSSNSKQNTTTHTVHKTKLYLSRDLRTHKTSSRYSQPRVGLLEAPPWLMTTAQEKQSCCGDSLTLVSCRELNPFFKLRLFKKISFLTVIPGGSKEKRGNSLSLFLFNRFWGWKCWDMCWD